MICSRCQHSNPDGARFCIGCGAPLPAAASAPSRAHVPNAVGRFLDTPDSTAQFAPQDVADGRVLAVLAYLWALILIPLLAGKGRPFVRYHVNQGILLLITFAVAHVLRYLPFGGPFFSGLGILFACALTVVGIFNAATGRARELPLIGSFTIL